MINVVTVPLDYEKYSIQEYIYFGNFLTDYIGGYWSSPQFKFDIVEYVLLFNGMDVKKDAVINNKDFETWAFLNKFKGD